MTESERLISVPLGSIYTDRDVSTISSSLAGRRIALCVGGGIAATEAPRIARALRRLGAEVHAYLTENATKFIGEASLEWATSRPVTLEPNGLAQHITTHDLVFVACATADLIGKTAAGICSDGVTTLIQSALGARIPLILAPTMHESLSQSPFVQRNLRTLQENDNVFLISSRSEESKLKSRFAEELADEVSHVFHRSWRSRNQKDQPVQRVLVTAGGTRVPIDKVRALSNLSTGDLGRSLVFELYRWGFSIDLALAEVQVEFPNYDSIIKHNVKELRAMSSFLNSIRSEDYIGLFMLAAVSDFEPEVSPVDGKISSKNDRVTLTLRQTPKLIAQENLKAISFKMVCKLTSDHGQNSKDAVSALQSLCGADLIFWNSIAEAFENGPIKGHLWETRRSLSEAFPCTSKSAVAQAAVEIFRNHLENILPR